MHQYKENITKKEFSDIKDEKGNIRKEILEKIVDNIIERNPLIYKRLAEI
jgi:hypothetical protein